MIRDFKELEVWLDRDFAAISSQFKGVIVSHSGGLDSTALLRLLWAYFQTKKNFQLAVFHLNYGLRQGESDGDKTFSETLAATLGLPFHTASVPLGSQPQTGVQAWAREERRKHYQRFAADGWAVALGHHQDDQAETVLLRLARGTAPQTMLGMQRWDAPLWRPLLGVTRAALAASMTTHGYPHREDRTNAESHYARNVIRHQVLPQLEKLYPGAAARIVACAEEAQNATPRAELAARLPDAPLSRRFLDAALQQKARALDVPGGGRLSPQPDGSLKPAPALAAGTKDIRHRQHAQSLRKTPISVLLEPDSHALLRRGTGFLAIDLVPAGELLVSCAPPDVTQGVCLFAEKDQQPVVLFAGCAKAADDHQTLQTECSQVRVNLRYLMDVALPLALQVEGLERGT